MADTEKILVKFLTGKKDDIEAKITEGVIDEGDFIATSDTDEFIFINANKEIKPLISRTKEEYISNINIGGIKRNDVIEAGTDLDSFIAQLLTGEGAVANKQVQLTRDSFSPEPGVYPYGTVVTVGVGAIADEPGLIKIYKKVDNGEPELVASQTGITVSATVASSTTTHKMELYATIDDNEESNKLVYEFNVPLVCWGSQFEVLTDQEISNKIAVGDVENMQLEGFSKGAFECTVQAGNKVVWFAVNTFINPNDIKGIFSEDGDNIANLFTATEIGNYLICRYVPKIAFPASTNITMRIGG